MNAPLKMTREEFQTFKSNYNWNEEKKYIFQIQKIHSNKSDKTGFNSNHQVIFLKFYSDTNEIVNFIKSNSPEFNNNNGKWYFDNTGHLVNNTSKDFDVLNQTVTVIHDSRDNEIQTLRAQTDQLTKDKETLQLALDKSKDDFDASTNNLKLQIANLEEKNQIPEQEETIPIYPLQLYEKATSEFVMYGVVKIDNKVYPYYLNKKNPKRRFIYYEQKWIEIPSGILIENNEIKDGLDNFVIKLEKQFINNSLLKEQNHQNNKTEIRTNPKWNSSTKLERKGGTKIKSSKTRKRRKQLHH